MASRSDIMVNAAYPPRPPRRPALMKFSLSVSFCLLAADPSAAEPDARVYDDQVRPILVAHCVRCHGPVKPKGDFRIDQLAPDFGTATSRDHWLAVLKRVQAGEMPPKGKPRPPEMDVAALTGWITARAADAAAKRSAEGRVVRRRLNRVEYENTVRDLLGVEVDLKDLFPVDGSAGGFDNVGEALHTSSFLLDRYLEAADTALKFAIANLPRPPLVNKRYDLKDERAVKVATESVYRKQDDALIMFSSSAWNTIVVGQFYPPDRGRYRVRISAYGIQSQGKPVTLRVDVGPMLMGTKNHLVDYYDVPADKPTVIEFTDHFEARNHFRISPYGLAVAQAVNKIGADKYDGPGLAVQWVEVEGPLYDSWPPESHRRLFGDLPQAKAPTYNYPQRVEVVSKDTEADAARILRKFLRRAYRRSVSDADVKPFLELVKARLAEKQSFEQAVRVALKAVLVSPGFLFLEEKPGTLDDFALASRLSYLLWSTMPDEELLALAEKKALANPATLRAQVERMLKDLKARAFTENFVGQWLGLRDIDFTEPSLLLYPEYDSMLRVAMVRETELFFSELLKDDLSLANFVASDFSMLNGRLARHYGISGVEGNAFRKVKLPPDSHRGGVLTMASVLKVTANGTTTSPVTRGAWVMDRILGTPPPRPPADVPALEPRTTRQTPSGRHMCVMSRSNRPARVRPGELRRDWRLARELPDHGQRGRSESGRSPDAVPQGQAGRSGSHDGGRPEVRQHRRFEEDPVERQGPAGPCPDGATRDLCDRGGAVAVGQAGD
jgi:mono/diheme cytochrome c family protein